MWNDAAADEYSGEMIGRRRRNGGSSQGFIYDRATDDVYLESDLFTPDGGANVELFSRQDRLNQTLAELEKALQRKRIHLDDLDSLALKLQAIRLDISGEDYSYYLDEIAKRRHDSFLSSLTKQERKEFAIDEQKEYILSLSLKERAEKFAASCRAYGIPMKEEKKSIDIGWTVKLAVEWLLITLFVIYFFYLA